MKTALSDQQRSLVKFLAKGMSLTDAALKAGYSPECAGQSGYQALKAIRRKMPALLDSKGLTDEALIEKYLKPALEAKETKFFAHEGIVKDERELIAWSPRLTALDMAFNLRGDYAKQSDLDPDHARMTVVFDIPRPKRNDADSRDT